MGMHPQKGGTTTGAGAAESLATEEGATEEGPRATKTAGSLDQEAFARRGTLETRFVSEENEIRPHYGRDSW